MNSYRLDFLLSKWTNKDGKDISVDVYPYQITWTNKESGKQICKLFINGMINNNCKESSNYFYKVACCFYKLNNNNIIYTVVIHSQLVTKIDINKIVDESLSKIEEK